MNWVSILLEDWKEQAGGIRLREGTLNQSLFGGYLELRYFPIPIFIGLAVESL